MTLKPGTTVSARGYPGTIIREYITGMWEVRLSSGVIVIPTTEIEAVS